MREFIDYLSVGYSYFLRWSLVQGLPLTFCSFHLRKPCKLNNFMKQSHFYLNMSIPFILDVKSYRNLSACQNFRENIFRTEDSGILSALFNIILPILCTEGRKKYLSPKCWYTYTKCYSVENQHRYLHRHENLTSFMVNSKWPQSCLRQRF